MSLPLLALADREHKGLTARAPELTELKYPIYLKKSSNCRI